MTAAEIAAARPAPRFDERTLLKLAGCLLVGGFLFFFVATQIHPHGSENDHPVIFQRYADTDGWIMIHFGQFAGVLATLGGFVVLYRMLSVRHEVPVLARCAVGAVIATAGVWAVLQAIDGVALKHAVDSWAEASGAEKAVRFADAEVLRWSEWGLQAYFRLLLGLTFVLFGVAVVRTGVVARWLGVVGIAGGLLYAAVGIAVGHTGLDKPGGLPISLLLLTFVVGIFVTGLRAHTNEPTED